MGNELWNNYAVNSHLFDSVKNIRDGNTISDPDQKQLWNAYVALNNATNCLKKYGSENFNLNRKNVKASHEADNKTLEDANKAFEQLRTAIEELSLSDISDSKEFVQFWGDTDRASKEITKLNSGYLNAPQKPESVKGRAPEPVFENGKQCHFIAAKDPEIGFDANTEKTARTFKREWVPCDAPLFSRDPSPDDVAQGYIGDCWLVSSLAAIAASNPDKIKEMMHQNDDNTVTVRLYNMAGEPVFVTVNDSVAELQGKTRTLDAYAQGAR